MYEPRFYRERMGTQRFRSFSVTHFETDLWLAVDSASYRSEMEHLVLQKVVELRKVITDYAALQKNFIPSLIPVEVAQNAPSIIKRMADAALRANVGPMAAVAGAFSEYIGEWLVSELAVKEVIIENGGDNYLKFDKPVSISVYAGNSPLSQKVGILIPPEFSPIGVCTSAGTFGHSLSFGKADAVMIACTNTCRADAYATSFGNKVKNALCIEPVLNEIKQIPEILSSIIICGDKIGMCGQFEIQFFE